MDIYELEDILKHFNIAQDQFQTISKHPEFVRAIAEHRATWNSSLNANERVKAKSATLIEGWLEEAHMRLHDQGESLNHKVEVAKLISRLAGIGVNNAEVNSAERFSININLGASAQLKFEKTIEHQKTINPYDYEELSAGVSFEDDTGTNTGNDNDGN